jgi:hypothetical protein
MSVGIGCAVGKNNATKGIALEISTMWVKFAALV